MTAPAFVYTSEPWAAHPFGRPIFDPNECRSFAPVLFRLSLHRRCIRVLHFEPIGRAAGLVGGILALRHNVFEAELAIPLWDFCDTLQMFSPDHITGRFSCSDVAIRTRGGVRMGRRDNSIDCDSGLRGRFCAGPLGHEATPFRRRKVEDETVIATSPTRASSALASWSRRIPVRRDKPRPARPCQPNWRAGALVPRFPLKSGGGYDASFARAARGCLVHRPADSNDGPGR